MKSNDKLITDNTYLGYPVQSDKGLPIQSIMDSILNQIHLMGRRYTRVLTFRFDLHLPEKYNSGTNEDVSKFFDRLRKRLDQRKRSTRLGFVWVREQEVNNKNTNSQGVHYHCAIFVSAHIYENVGCFFYDDWGEVKGAGLAKDIGELWLDITGGRVWFGRKGETFSDGSNAYTAKPRILEFEFGTRECKNKDVLADVILHYSYLAKNHPSKDYAPTVTPLRRYGVAVL